MDLGIRGLKQAWQAHWWNTSCMELPGNLKACQKKEQRGREKAANAFIKELCNEAKDMPEDKELQKLWADRVGKRARDYAIKHGYFTQAQMDMFVEDGFYEATMQFIQGVHSFDPKLCWEDTFQAIRNVWIMNSIQILFGQKACFTPSIFAYSMLYPYTDNYLDDPSVCSDEKVKISARFRKRLEGESLKPDNHYEDCLYRLVAMIEGQYQRALFPKVYAALLGIHDAQIKSLFQQHGVMPCYEKDILGMSVEKGGMSVLADAYLIKGDLTSREANFMFGFGVILQLADDLQDILEDQGRQHTTVFSQTAGKWPLDSLTSRLLRMIADLKEIGKCFHTQQSSVVLSLMEHNCSLLTLKAVSENKSFYSQSYYRQLEQYAPFRFSYLRTLDKRLKREYSRIKQGLGNKCSIDNLLKEGCIKGA